MNVTLLSYTPNALDLMLFTKETRLSQSPDLLDEIAAWPWERKMAQLDYMRGTIQSSWEFVDYTFAIEDVTRAFTHQLVRTRHGSYAQQSQRTVDMSGFNYVRTGKIADVDDIGMSSANTPTQGLREHLGYHVANYGYDDERGSVENPANWYDMTMDVINLAYQRMTALGVPPQDARGVLPTNITTNIVAKFSLRTLADMAKLRLCTRTQGEYQDVFRAMRKAVLAVHPWAERFIRVHCAATGVCAFPNYHECPIKGPVYNPDTGRRWDEATTEITMSPKRPATRDEIQASWESVRYEAVPHRQLPVVEAADA